MRRLSCYRRAKVAYELRDEDGAAREQPLEQVKVLSP